MITVVTISSRIVHIIAMVTWSWMSMVIGLYASPGEKYGSIRQSWLLCKNIIIIIQPVCKMNSHSVAHTHTISSSLFLFNFDEIALANSLYIIILLYSSHSRMQSASLKIVFNLLSFNMQHDATEMTLNGIIMLKKMKCKRVQFVDMFHLCN